MPPQSPPASRRITQCALGDTLCDVYVLSEAEYQALPPGRRPAAAEHVEGLGWVVALRGRGPGPETPDTSI